MFDTVLFDPAAVELVRDLTPAWLVVVLILLSFLGSAAYQGPTLVLLYWIDGRERIATWIGIVLGSYVLRSTLKSLNTTTRPTVEPAIDATVFPSLLQPLYTHPVEISTTSFPSGHMMAATVLWGLVAVDSTVASRRTRCVLALTVVWIVGLSRIVVGAHYVGDVVAGFVFGLVFLGAMLAVRDWGRRPVETVFAATGTLAATLLLFSESTTGVIVLGVCVGVLLARLARPTELPHPARLEQPDLTRLFGTGSLLLMGLVAFWLATTGHPLAPGVAAIPVGALVISLPQYDGVGVVGRNRDEPQTP